MTTSYFQIFKSPYKQIFDMEYTFEELFGTSFWSLDISDVKTKYLLGIKVGTIDAITTDNVFFGIKADRNVKLHVVHVATTLNMGIGTEYAAFAALNQEIADTLMKNDFDPIRSFEMGSR